jgi:hypothetical protein
MVTVRANRCCMPDPTFPDPTRSGDRLRALEDERIQRSTYQADALDGFREASQAWSEDRSTAYLLRKSWADPVSRALTVIVVSIIALVWAYLLLS